MSDGGGDFDFGFGDKGSSEKGSDTITDPLGDTGFDLPKAVVTAPTDFSYTAPDLGNLDYLSGGAGGVSDSGGTGGFVNPTYADVGGFVSPISGDTGGFVDPTPIGGTVPIGDVGGFVDPGGGTGGFVDPTGGFVDPGGGTGGDIAPIGDVGGFVDPTGGTGGGTNTDVLTGGTGSSGDTPPVPSQPGHGFSADAFNYGGPAGSSSVPNVAALNENIGAVSSNPTAALATFSGAAPGGTSAAGDSLAGTGGGSGDLSASKKDEGWLSKLTNNPLGTALAAGALGYNIFQSRAQADALKGPTGLAPGANLANLAAPAAQTGRELTDEGRDIARTGVDDLRTRAAGVPAATAQGREITANSAANLEALARSVPEATAPGREITANSAANLEAQARSLGPNAQILQDRGTSLTGYVGTGTLPPEMQAEIDQGTSDAKTARISFYASKGMPTDPTRNSSLRSDLERIDRDAVVLSGRMAQQLAQTGTSIYGAGVQGSQASGTMFNQAGGQGTSLSTAGVQGAQTSGSLFNQAGGQGTQLSQVGNQSEQTAGGLERNAASIGENFITSGISSSGLARDSYNQLARMDNEQAERTQRAIAAMAAALSGQTISNQASNVARTV